MINTIVGVYFSDIIPASVPNHVRQVMSTLIILMLWLGSATARFKNAMSILRENDIEVEVMQNDMIIEAFFMQSKNCKIIGVLTSVLEYAHVFGHEAYSIYGLFEKQPPTFFDRMTGFWENIENLKE